MSGAGHSAPATDWRSIVLLNLVSAVAQIGQFGIAFVVVPVWLAQQGLDATQLGLFASALWLGQLPGLGLAPALIARFGARAVTLAGLLCTTCALGWMPCGDWPGWLPAGALAGFGISLRWIGVEPWLYHLAPGEARGRLVGIHETLIGLAPVVAPALAGWIGLTGSAPFVLGIAFTALAAVPLAMARPAARLARAHKTQVQPRLPRDPTLRLGVAFALLGGAIEAAFAGLFPLFGSARGLDAGHIAQLLTAFGAGGLLLQYAAGWLADHRGLASAMSLIAAGAALAAVLAAVAPGPLMLAPAVLLLGGFITAFLTLALVAATSARDGQLEDNVSRISMTYSASAIAGPLLSAASMQWLGAGALLWSIALLAVLALGLVRVIDGIIR